MRACPRSLLTLGLAVVAGAALTTGCSGSDEPRRPAAEDSPSTGAPADTPTGSATATPSDSPSTPAPSTAAASPATLTDRLLASAEVPGLSSSWHWQDGRTGPGTRAFGVCAQGSLIDIGATDAMTRSYFPPDDSDDSAGEQLAEFPDAKTAVMAWSVLAAWHDHCAKKAGRFPGLAVRPFTTTATSAGAARWYLLSWSPAGEETDRFETIGMVRDGTRISVLRMTHSGPGHHYPAGQDPMVGMVTAAAGKLG